VDPKSRQILAVPSSDAVSTAICPGGGYFQRLGAAGGRATALDLTRELNDKIVLVGSFDVDWDADMPQPGPQLLAWGLSDRLNAGTGAAAAFYQPESRIWVEGLEALVFAVLTALVFAMIYAYIKRLRTRPALIAAAAAVIAIVCLAAVALLRLNQHTVPPVGLATFAIVIVGLLAWHFAYKFLLTGQAEGSGRYDVFVSYSRAHADWVKKNVYEPLKAMRKPDGSALEIYFDTDVMQLGKDFTANYMWAIVDSRVFIAVFTDDYYAKNHSRNEIDVAYHRKVSKLIKLLPIAVSPAAVPDIFRKDDYVDAAGEPNFMDKVRRAIMAALDPGATPA
jgi:TIR domain